MIKKLIPQMNYIRKRKGFTLTELIAVMAIIAILASAIAPKILGYIDKGKKTSALEQARQVVMAVDSYNITNSNSEIADTSTFDSFKDKLSSANFIDTADMTYINGTNTYENLYNIVKGQSEFSLNGGKITISTQTSGE